MPLHQSDPVICVKVVASDFPSQTTGGGVEPERRGAKEPLVSKKIERCPYWLGKCPAEESSASPYSRVSLVPFSSVCKPA